MQRLSLVAVLAICLVQPVWAEEIKAISGITSVTVFPSGAEVTRSAKLALDAGEHTIVFEDLPAQAIRNSIRVEGKASADLVIGSVDSRRLSVPQADAVAGERQRVEDEIERLTDQRVLYQGEVKTAQTQLTLVTGLSQLPNRQPPAGSNQTVTQPDWTQLLNLIGTGMADAQRAAHEAKIKIRDVNDRIKDLRRKLTELAPKREDRTEVKVFVSAGSALEADLKVRYQVSSASWSALYDARLVTGSKSKKPELDIVRRAKITQRTGEAWENVALTLSSTRPRGGSAAPKLRVVTVDYQKTPTPRPVATSAPEAYESRGGIAGVATMDQAVQQHSVRRRAAQKPKMEVARERDAVANVSAFQALFDVPGAVTIASTGEAKNVQIGVTSFKPELNVRAVPKFDQRAYLYAHFKSDAEAPLLPGQVSLFRDGTFAGNGRLPLLAGGEEHSLGFGVDDKVRVKYTVNEEKQGETGLITSSRTDNRNYRITIKNLHAQGIDLIVRDQVPLSKNEDIKVDLIASPSPSKRDVENKRGVVEWRSKLKAGGEKTIDFGYRVTWPAGKEIRYSR